MVKGAITKFPADGLRPIHRLITGHNKEGKGVFIHDDAGDHHRLLVDGEAAANIIYSTQDCPVDMNDDKDLEFAKNNEVFTNPSNRPAQFSCGSKLV